MPGRKRTAKSLGTRHDLNYFKHRSLSRKWRLWLSFALPVVAIGWLAGQGFRGRRVEYSAGPLGAAHAVFGNQCSTCHVAELAGVKLPGFRKHVSDKACLSCHEAPPHHADEAFTPECASCHREHIGAVTLAKTPDQDCVSCHSDLHRSKASTAFVAHVSGFNVDHPEFALLRKTGLDPGTIAFNHAVHLASPIIGPDGKRVQLGCNDCHRPLAEAGAPWPYAAAGTLQARSDEASNKHLEIDPNSGRRLMAPVSYQNNCSGCHTLQFDRRFSESVPHKSPDVVHQFMLAKFRDYLQNNPMAWREPQNSARRIPGGGIMAARMVQAISPKDWLEQRSAEAERLLWGKTCRQCHQLSPPKQSATLPEIKPANITSRWFTHAVFNHQSHQALQCVSCHQAALSGTDTKDVMLPSIKTCQSCHNGQPTAYGHAENRCFECHEYHNWTRRTNFNGKYRIHDLIGQLQSDPKSVASGPQKQPATSN